MSHDQADENQLIVFLPEYFRRNSGPSSSRPMNLISSLFVADEYTGTMRPCPLHTVLLCCAVGSLMVATTRHISLDGPGRIREAVLLEEKSMRTRLSVCPGRDCTVIGAVVLPQCESFVM